MKNWEKLQADENMILSKHFTKGRAGRSIKYVVLHHNAGNLSVQGCYDTWQTRPASAHYQVEAAGRIGQLVHDADTAWHAGDFTANQVSIGIEHANNRFAPDWTVSEQTLDNGAHLVAALCRFYKLGRPVWGVNVFGHSHFVATGCPGALGGVQRDAYMARAASWYDRMGGNASPAPVPAVKPVVQPNSVGLIVDGYWGATTTRRLQAVLRTPVDGVVSSQDAYWKLRNPGLTGGWQWVDAPQGSQLIVAFQRKLGVTADGLLGPATVKALQRRLGTPVDGVVSGPSQCVMKLQQNLNNGKVF